MDTPLHIGGTGIFGTFVTWDDIEKDMQRVLGTKATFGGKKSVRNIDDGNGFLSVIGLVTPDWQGVGWFENLPRRFIVKLPSTINVMNHVTDKDDFFAAIARDPTKFVRTNKKMHNTEVYMYSLFEKYKEQRVKRPKVYYARAFSEENPVKGYILMEFFDDLESLHVFDNLTVEELYQPLRSIAALQAFTTKLTQEELSKFKVNHSKEFFNVMYSETMQRNVVAQVTEFCGSRSNALVKRMNEDYKHVGDFSLDQLSEQIGMGRVLCHGDLWSTNMIWRREKSGRKLSAVVDFQTAMFGNPVYDLARIMNSCLSGKNRREHQFEILKTFYGFLLEELNGAKAPYTLEQLIEAYKRYLPIGVYIFLPFTCTPLEKFCSKKIKEYADSEKETAMFEKLEALISDMFEYHDKNKEQNNNIK